MLRGLDLLLQSFAEQSDAAHVGDEVLRLRNRGQFLVKSERKADLVLVAVHVLDFRAVAAQLARPNRVRALGQVRGKLIAANDSALVADLQAGC